MTTSATSAHMPIRITNPVLQGLNGLRLVEETVELGNMLWDGGIKTMCGPLNSCCGRGFSEVAVDNRDGSFDLA